MTDVERALIGEAADPETLLDRILELVRHPSAMVRAGVAINPSLPSTLWGELASDEDWRVRDIIALRRTKVARRRKMAETAARQEALAPLIAMIEPAAQRMRRTLAASVKDMPDGPRDIVLALARDPDNEVAEPVILSSPVLGSAELLALIAGKPPVSTLDAIARRPRIEEAVSDALVNAGNDAVISSLLRNQTARIREATVEALSAQSEVHVDWQDALVRRPALSQRAQRVLAEIVTGPLLITLRSRPDFDAHLLPGPQVPAPRPQVVHDASALPPASALAQAGALKASGKLSEGTILDALRRNAVGEASALLAVKADMPLQIVEQARNTRNGRLFVSLCWKAGLSMATALSVQTVLGGIPPGSLVQARRDGDFALSQAEMQAELELRGRSGRGLRAWVPRRLAG